jgi:hypothetical protein
MALRLVFFGAFSDAIGEGDSEAFRMRASDSGIVTFVPWQ